MNTPNNSQPCQIDENYCKFAAETLLQRLRGFEDQINGRIKNDGDIEFVYKVAFYSTRKNNQFWITYV